ncbi:MAG: InlB B-repeat-containing protein [Deferribacteraceae bacterium]|jgi:uncharacterized repeat protein (TIGR02543 family)|nr:InlB B-repeat-containing protein [Deferribacteraceae bacterium]
MKSIHILLIIAIFAFAGCGGGSSGSGNGSGGGGGAVIAPSLPEIDREVLARSHVIEEGYVADESDADAFVQALVAQGFESATSTMATGKVQTYVKVVDGVTYRAIIEDVGVTYCLTFIAEGSKDDFNDLRQKFPEFRGNLTYTEYRSDKDGNGEFFLNSEYDDYVQMLIGMGFTKSGDTFTKIDGDVIQIIDVNKSGIFVSEAANSPVMRVVGKFLQEATLSSYSEQERLVLRGSEKFSQIMTTAGFRRDLESEIQMARINNLFELVDDMSGYIQLAVAATAGGVAPILYAYETAVDKGVDKLDLTSNDIAEQLDKRLGDKYPEEVKEAIAQSLYETVYAQKLDPDLLSEDAVKGIIKGALTVSLDEVKKGFIKTVDELILVNNRYLQNKNVHLSLEAMQEYFYQEGYGRYSPDLVNPVVLGTLRGMTFTDLALLGETGKYIRIVNADSKYSALGGGNSPDSFEHTNAILENFANAQVSLYVAWYKSNFDALVGEDLKALEQLLSNDITAQYVVKFDSDGGTSVPDQIVEVGDKVIKPADPIKEGYEFVGWWRDTGSSITSSYYNFNDSLGTDDRYMTLKAVWKVPEIIDDRPLNYFRFMYEDDNGTMNVKQVSVPLGEKVARPADPARAGYIFLDWVWAYSLEQPLAGEIYDFDTVWNELVLIELVAQWMPIGEVVEYTVTFDRDNGNSITSQKVMAGGRVAKPSDPSKTGYTFIGWLLNGQPYNFNLAVRGDITLVASWNIDDGFPASCMSEEQAIADGWIVVKTADDLAAIKAYGNYILMNDIDLAGRNWVAIPALRGKFYGNCNVIRNMTITGEVTGTRVGLFGYIYYTARVKDVALENINIDVLFEGDVGGIAGYIAGNVYDSYVTGSIKALDNVVGVSNDLRLNVGGIAGRTGNTGNRTIVYNSYSDVTINAGGTYYLSVGGLVGNTSTMIVDGSYSRVTITADGQDGVFVGGLIGSGVISTDNSYSVGQIDVRGEGSVIVGGIAGNGNTNTALIKNTYSSVAITAVGVDDPDDGNDTDVWAGGLVGSTSNGLGVNDSYFTETIRVSSPSDAQVGGIVGESYGGYVRNSYSTAIINVNGESVYAGGIAGYTSLTNIINSYSAGRVSAESSSFATAGGIVGSASYNNRGSWTGLGDPGGVMNAYSTADVSAFGVEDVSAGGIAGWLGVNSKVENAYATGAVSAYGQSKVYAGGIVGNRSYNASNARKSVAINRSISSTHYSHRITGSGGGTNNYALMSLAADSHPDTVVLDPPDATINGSDGLGVDGVMLKTQAFYENQIDWLFGNNDDNPWSMGSSTGYPVFYWQ